jgi:hypothetical protein
VATDEGGIRSTTVPDANLTINPLVIAIGHRKLIMHVNIKNIANNIESTEAHIFLKKEIKSLL